MAGAAAAADPAPAELLRDGSEQIPEAAQVAQQPPAPTPQERPGAQRNGHGRTGADHIRAAGAPEAAGSGPPSLPSHLWPRPLPPSIQPPIASPDPCIHFHPPQTAGLELEIPKLMLLLLLLLTGAEARPAAHDARPGLPEQEAEAAAAPVGRDATWRRDPVDWHPSRTDARNQFRTG